MLTGVINRPSDLIPLVRDNEQGLLLVIAVKKAQRLRRCILVNNGIQRLIPAKEISGNKEDDRIKTQNDREPVQTALLGKSKWK